MDAAHADQQRRVVVGHVLGAKTLRILLGDEPRVHAPGKEARVLHQCGLKRDVGRHAADHERVQRVAHAPDRLVARRTVRDQLGDHRIVVHRDLAALVHAGVHPHHPRHLGRRDVFHQPPDRGQEAAERILGVDAALDRPPGELEVLLREPELLARGDADHLLHQVESGDHLGHRVLDLQARVHLEEVEVAVAIDHELHGPGGLVAHGFRERDRLLAHRAASLVVEERRRRFLDHLLVASLNRALALPQIERVAVGVAQHLNFDVPRLDDVFLDEDAIVAKRTLRFVAAALEPFPALVVAPGHAQALAAAACARLDHHRVADAARDLHRLVGAFDHVGVARDGVDLRFVRKLLR